jgi:hypothetical protein
MQELDIRRNGTIYHKGLKRFLKLHDNGRGYLCFSYKGKTYPLHRVIAEKFCKRAHQSHKLVMHKNHKKHDCRASNLKWGTHSDNLRDAHKAGSMGHSRKAQAVAAMRYGHAVYTFKSINKAAIAMDTTRANIGSVLSGKSKTAAGWRWQYV